MAQPLHRGKIVRDRSSRKVVQNIVVIDRVAGQEQPVRFVQKPDPTGRMARQMQDGKAAITKVDPVAFGQHRGQRCGAQGPVGRRPARIRRRVSHPGPIAEFGGKGFHPRQAGKARSLACVATTIGKLMQSADMVDMGMACHGDDRPVTEIKNPAQGHDPTAEIKLKVAVPAPHCHHACPKHQGHGRLQCYRHAGGHNAGLKPAHQAPSATTCAAAASAPGPCGMSSARIPASITPSAPSVMWAFTWPICATRRKP